MRPPGKTVEVKLEVELAGPASRDVRFARVIGDIEWPPLICTSHIQSPTIEFVG